MEADSCSLPLLAFSRPADLSATVACSSEHLHDSPTITALSVKSNCSTTRQQHAQHTSACTPCCKTPMYSYLHHRADTINITASKQASVLLLHSILTVARLSIVQMSLLLFERHSCTSCCSICIDVETHALDFAALEVQHMQRPQLAEVAADILDRIGTAGLIHQLLQLLTALRNLHLFTAAPQRLAPVKPGWKLAGLSSQ